MPIKFPKSKRRPEHHVCKNCDFITFRIQLPHAPENPDSKEVAKHMRAVAVATHICHHEEGVSSDFFCTFSPEWKRIDNESVHHCGQFLLRPNWQAGYQDIERTWEEVDRVYATRWDCCMQPAA